MDRRWATAVLCAIGAAAAAWWLAAEREPGEEPVADSRMRAGTTRSEPATKPALSPAPTAVSKEPAPKGRRSSIHGTARIDGSPVTASVELRFVEGNESRSIGTDDPPAEAAPPVATAETGSDGAFAFEHLAPGSYMLLARHGATHVAEHSVWLRADGWAAREDVELVADGAREMLRGRVLDADGAPFHGWIGADLAGWQRGRAGHGVPWMPTAQDGGFELTGLPPFTVRLRVSRGRGSVLQGPLVDASKVHETEVRLAETLRPVEVRVVAAGKDAPVAGAGVRAEFAGIEWGSPTTNDAGTTDAAGVARLAWPRDKPLKVSASARGFEPGERTADKTAASVTVELSPAMRATIRVVDAATGGPAVGALVCPTLVVDREYPSDIPGKAADADGVVEFDDLSRGSGAFRVMGGGWFSADVVAAAARSKGEDEREIWPYSSLDISGTKLEIKAVRTGSIRGRVLDADGAPAAGVAVQPYSRPGAWNRNGHWPDVATDAEGRFVVDDLLPGETFKLTAEGDAHSGRARGEAVASAESPPEVELRFAKGGSLTVEVRDAETDAPLGGVAVTCREPKEKDSFFVSFDVVGKSARTGADGRARVGPMVPGAYDVTASARGRSQGPKLRVTEADFGEGADRVLVFRLARGVPIVGRVLHEDGSPASEYDVCVEGVERDDYFASIFGRGYDVAADGSFEIPDLEPGEYEVALSRWPDRAGFASTRAVAGGPPVEIRFGSKDETSQATPPSPAHTERDELEVRFEAPDGSPLSGAVLYFHREGFGCSAGTVEDGRAGLSREFAGGSLLVMRDVRGAWPDGAAETFAELPAEPSGPVTIRLAPARSVRGRVVDETGRAIPGVRLFLDRDPSRHSFASREPDAESGSLGNFDLRWLGAFPYRVRAEVSREFLVPKAVDLGATETELVVRVEHGVGPIVRVVDADDRPVAGARVSVRSGNWDRNVEDSAVADASGIVRLRPLQTDETWQLDASPPEGRDDLLAFRDESWTPAQERVVRFEKSFRVRGVVVDWNGAPVAGVPVYWSKSADPNAENTYWELVTTNAAGSFSIERLAKGSVRIAAGGFADRVGMMMNGWAERDLEEADAPLRVADLVPAGTTDARISLARASCLEVRVTGWPEGRDLPDLPRLATADGKHSHPALARGDKPLLFSGLEKDREYVLLVRVENRNLVGYASGLRAGGTAELKLETGLALEGNVRLPAGDVEFRDLELRLAGVEVRENVDADGKFRIRCLPPVACEVRASVRLRDGTFYDGHATAVPGKPVTVEVKLYEGR